eukprot:TRINITY_DN13289_c0_g1_i1.p1 TRINITY_DN13289_c0_g1~~TRINITY_DN13289_c0_g1_i1.p1  ORF type:complete len:140 (+),score=38.05 TRINITY_DN13289_c0_g1_i1:185-604(+)
MSSGSKPSPRHRFSSSLSDLDVRIQDYGLVQLEDEVWLCGGHGDRYDQIRTCLILSLVDGRWRIFEQKMIHPRMRPVMVVDQGAVIVMSGVTSDVNSNTGCRDTQEVFHPLYSDGWAVEDIGEVEICHEVDTHVLNIDC